MATFIQEYVTLTLLWLSQTKDYFTLLQWHTHTQTRLTALFRDYPGEPVPVWILLKQKTVSGSGISWAICQSAPNSRQITTPAPHRSVFTGPMPFLPPNQQRQSTEGTLLQWKLWKTVKKGKVFPYSLPSVGPGADPGVQAVSLQVTWSESRHIPPSSSLPLLSARPAFTFVALTRWRYL